MSAKAQHAAQLMLCPAQHRVKACIWLKVPQELQQLSVAGCSALSDAVHQGRAAAEYGMKLPCQHGQQLKGATLTP